MASDTSEPIGTLAYITLCSRLNNRLAKHLTGEKAGLPFMARMIRTPVNLLGCGLTVFAKHIESQFVDGMGWHNMKKWHIDHIYPIAAVDVHNDTEVFAVCNYRNLRPLWARDNCSKQDSVTTEATQHFRALCDLVRQPWHRVHVPHFSDAYQDPLHLTAEQIIAMPPGAFAEWVAYHQELAKWPKYGDFTPPETG